MVSGFRSSSSMVSNEGYSSEIDLVSRTAVLGLSGESSTPESGYSTADCGVRLGRVTTGVTGLVSSERRGDRPRDCDSGSEVVTGTATRAGGVGATGSVDITVIRDTVKTGESGTVGAEKTGGTGVVDAEENKEKSRWAAVSGATGSGAGGGDTGVVVWQAIEETASRMASLGVSLGWIGDVLSATTGESSSCKGSGGTTRGGTSESADTGLPFSPSHAILGGVSRMTVGSLMVANGVFVGMY